MLWPWAISLSKGSLASFIGSLDISVDGYIKYNSFKVFIIIALYVLSIRSSNHLFKPSYLVYILPIRYIKPIIYPTAVP